LRLFCFTGAKPVAVDVRFTDLVIDADQVDSKAPNTVTRMEGGSGGETTGARGWLGAGVLLALGAVLLAGIPLGVWYYVRHGSSTEKQHAREPSPNNHVKVEKPDLIACVCDGCGKTLRVKTSLAGKKVKCSQCGEAVHVPGINV